ncbi:MAG: NAD(P)H-hydrate dehydratase, partial [Candidatus Eisenbacteria bacterium]
AKGAVSDFLQASDVLALGPGLSRNAESAALARQIVPFAGKPTVLDADGLNAFVGHVNLFARAGGHLIITPHVVEMSRLSGETPAAIAADRVSTAKRFAAQLGIVVLLKGAPTVIAQPEGPTYVNPTGNEGLASGGSGDVLTGIIAALLGQGLPVVQAAALGAYLHGLAADLARETVGEEGMIASDLIDCLPAAIMHAKKGEPAGFIETLRGV